MRRIVWALILLPMIIATPAPADQSGAWVTTAPTTGGEPLGYEWQLNVDGGGWATMSDDPDPADLEYPYVQPGGTVVQCRVAAYHEIVTAVVDGDGLLTGKAVVIEYGPWSELSDPNVVNDPQPGGCGCPVWESR